MTTIVSNLQEVKIAKENWKKATINLEWPKGKNLARKRLLIRSLIFPCICRLCHFSWPMHASESIDTGNTVIVPTSVHDLAVLHHSSATLKHWITTLNAQVLNISLIFVGFRHIVVGENERKYIEKAEGEGKRKWVREKWWEGKSIENVDGERKRKWVREVMRGRMNSNYLITALTTLIYLY